MLDRMKLAPLFAFHIAFKIATKKKGMSSLELTEEYELRQKTVWVEKARGIDPFGHAGLTPLGKIRLTPFE